MENELELFEEPHVKDVVGPILTVVGREERAELWLTPCQESPGLGPLAWLLPRPPPEWEPTWGLQPGLSVLCCTSLRKKLCGQKVTSPGSLLNNLSVFLFHLASTLLAHLQFGGLGTLITIPLASPTHCLFFLTPPSSLIWHYLHWILSICISKKQPSLNCSWGRCSLGAGTTIPPLWALEGQLLGVGDLVIYTYSQLFRAYYYYSMSRESCDANHAPVDKWQVFTLVRDSAQDDVVDASELIAGFQLVSPSVGQLSCWPRRWDTDSYLVGLQVQLLNP